MQDFIIELSQYARGIDSDFILIPQNGEEMLFDDIDAEKSGNTSVLNAIDGVGVEEVYDGSKADEYRFNMLKKLSSEKILVADHLSDNSLLSNHFSFADQNNWIAFPRQKENYDYKVIQSQIHNENTLDINSLSDAKNYLYLISSENYATKNDFISTIDATNYDMVIIDAFFGDELFSSADILALQTKPNGARRLVIAYMSIGSAENYRYYWQDKWRRGKPNFLKKKYDGYKDECWVEYWDPEWKKIIYGNDDSYTKKFLNAGFDGTYLDNVEAFYFLYHRK